MPLLPLAEMTVLTILLRSAGMIVLVVLAFLGVRALTRWIRDADDAGADIGAGFSLSDLRQFHKAGKMTNEEFEKAKAILLAAAKKPAAKPQPPQRPPR